LLDPLPRVAGGLPHAEVQHDPLCRQGEPVPPGFRAPSRRRRGAAQPFCLARHPPQGQTTGGPGQADYLRALVKEITSHLQKLES
jgi:hypothetical protein